MIQIKQTGSHRPVYTFEKSWADSGGILHGNNFLTDICTLGVNNSNLCIDKVDNIWCISSIETDPDYLFYLWKKAHGDTIAFYISESELLFLYEFFKLNGFEMMLDDIDLACVRLSAKKCILF